MPHRTPCDLPERLADRLHVRYLNNYFDKCDKYLLIPHGGTGRRVRVRDGQILASDVECHMRNEIVLSAKPSAAREAKCCFLISEMSFSRRRANRRHGHANEDVSAARSRRELVRISEEEEFAKRSKTIVCRGHMSIAGKEDFLMTRCHPTSEMPCRDDRDA